MNKVIIIRYCEIHLKKKNRGYFERMLGENINRALAGLNYKYVKIHARYLIEEFNENDYDEILSRLLKVGGIHSVSPALVLKSDAEEIYNTVLSMCDGKEGTFKVETNRADKTFPVHSVEMSAEAGGRILDAYGDKLKVNLKHPDFIVNIDIRESGETLIYTDIVRGMGGLPVGSAGKGLLLLSGGIDSPVAGYMMAKRGMRVKALHFHSYPYTSDAAKQKVIDLAKIIAPYTAGVDLYTVSVTHIQEAIHRDCPEEAMITILRRFMMRIANLMCEKTGTQAIITGESLGQVASQTVESLTTSNAVAEYPVLRPLIAFDKLDIISIAEKIGTYETSVLPYEDCCTVFLPKFPLIRPQLEKIKKFESKLDVDGLIAEAMNTIEKIKI